MPSTAPLVDVTTRDGVGVIRINNPPVNALSPGVPEGISAAVTRFQEDKSIQAIVLIGGGKTFIAGADIKAFEKITSGKKRDLGAMRAMLVALEDCPKPVIAAIHGTALGGGLETAMACHYRVADSSAQVGQPEVKLGLIPGAGGTQRLPRLAGVAKAAELCAGGQPIGAADALASGIVDRVVKGDLLDGAVAFGHAVATRGGPPRRVRDLSDKLTDAAANIQAIAEAREALSKRGNRLIAPLKAVEAVEAATKLAFDEGCRRERELFEECLFSEQSKALIHVFFSERAVSKIPGLPRDTPLIPIGRAAVVGAGTMGGGITMAYANAGIPVLLKEISQDALDHGLATIRKNYAASVKKGKLTQQQMDHRLSLIAPTLTYERFREADIVVEAVFEGMDLKKKVFAELNDSTRDDAILASNTSTLDIDQIAAVTSRPQQVIGHHFFSPANVMRLLEIVRGNASSPAVISTSLALARTLGKVGALVGNCRGFVGNRMFGAYQREAQFLLEEGARVEQVDAALVEFGVAMGPLAVGDLAGLDVSWRIRKEYKHLTPPGMRNALAADRLCEMGRFGQKTGAGWYRYSEGNRTPVPDPDVETIIVDAARAAGIQRRTVTTQEIIERTIYALVNEGAKILEEGFALRASDIDIIYINGYGFPAYRGGPMWYADVVGLPHVLERICQYEKVHGNWWRPASLLQELVRNGKTFASLDQEKTATP
jgi:3-hydroxyacyl-CoA dehydrogenase